MDLNVKVLPQLKQQIFY